MKKFLLIIVVALCLPVTMWAYDFEVDGIYYTIGSNNEVSVSAPLDESGNRITNTIVNMIIPATVEYEGTTYTVTSIDEQAYAYDGPSSIVSYAGNLTTLIIPSTVKTIGALAFRSASSLTGITILSAETIGNQAFAYTGVVTLTLPSNLVTITTSFTGCSSLKTVVLLNGDLQNPWDSTTFQYATTLYVPKGYGELFNARHDESGIGTYGADWFNALVYFSTIAEFEFVEVDIEVKDDEGDGYATYYNEEYDVILPDGIEAYTISDVDEDGVLAMDNVYGLIPAKTAVLLKGEVGQHTNAPEVVPSAAAVETTNLLYGSSTETTTSVNGNTEDYYFYKLTYGAEEGYTDRLGFYWGAANGAAFTMPANKAWLAIPQSQFPAGAPALKLGSDGEETTGITSVATPATSAPAGIYSLQGVRVSDMSQKGVYIVDGKKVIVK